MPLPVTPLPAQDVSIKPLPNNAALLFQEPLPTALPDLPEFRTPEHSKTLPSTQPLLLELLASSM
jgi:hypothetical protein